MKELISRFSSPTPASLKKLQIFLLILSGVVAYIHPFSILTKNVLDHIAGFLAGGAVVAQFGTTDIGIIKSAISDPSSLLTVAPELISQIGAIHAAIVTPPAPITMEQVKADIVDLTAPSLVAPASGSGVSDVSDPIITNNPNVEQKQVI